jgi:cytoskeletal protein CcmA (bactofilin family)
MTSWKAASSLVQGPASASRIEGGGSHNAVRKLVVGSGIFFSGEIKCCDCLVVEGTVKANIADCNEIHVAEGGLFTGSAVVERAEIRGRFEGSLSVSDRLMIHSSGRVTAEIRYNQLEVERGGEISGDIQAQGQAHGAAAPKPASELGQPAAVTAMPRRA